MRLEQLDRKGQPAHQGRKVPQAPRALRDRKARRVILERQGLKGQPAHQDRKAPQAP